MDTAEDKLIPIRIAIQELPISVSHLYVLIQKKQIPAVRFGDRVFLKRAVLDKLKAAGAEVCAGVGSETAVLGGN
jgi:excisionase family DNA binding protein